MSSFKLNSYGFFRCAAANPPLVVGDLEHNKKEIINTIDLGLKKHVNFLVLPELSVSGYTMGDLFFQNRFIFHSYDVIKDIALHLQKIDSDMLVALGAPFICDNQLFNCAFLLQRGKILGIVPKTHIPNYNEYYEKRWFSSATKRKSSYVSFLDFENIPFSQNIIFSEKNSNTKIALEICEDLWVPIPQSSHHCLYGANIIGNLSSSNEIVGKSQYRRDLVKQQSGRCITSYIYSSSGADESTTDLVFSGHLLIAENASVLAEKDFDLDNDARMIIHDIDIEKLQHDRIKTNSFMENVQDIDYIQVSFSMTFKPVQDLIRSNLTKDIFKQGAHTEIHKIVNIQSAGLIKRIKHIGCKKLVVGISGGLDSTLALLVCVNAMKYLGLANKNIVSITMPGFGTTGKTYNNAVALAKLLDTDLHEISIKDACIQHLKDIQHPLDAYDITYENVQARERTQVLMDIANKENAIVVGTGNLSELALGWCTYNADQMSMYAVNASVPKTLVREIITWFKEHFYSNNNKLSNILDSIISTKISPELLPANKNDEIVQDTEALIGDYALNDFFMYYMLRHGFSPKKILFLANIAFRDIYSCGSIKVFLKKFFIRFFNNQFKRSCMPDSPKVGSISLSPRGDWRMPSDASYRLWTAEIESL